MKVRAEMFGNRIHVQSPFEYKDRIKAIIGARWAPKDRVWTFPLDMETCRRLRDAFGDDLEILPGLWEWAKDAVGTEAKATALINVTDIDVMEAIDLPRVREEAPTMWAAMQNRPYQPVAAFYMATVGRCLNGDEPGVGKTIETLGALVERGVRGPVLILAPKTSCLVVWEAEIRRWLADDIPYTVTNVAGLTPAKRDAAFEGFRFLVGPAAGGAPDGIHFMIANAEQAGIKKFTVCPAGICDGDEDWCPELAQHKNKSEARRPFLHSIAWEAIVADETHKWLINTRGKQASQVGYGFTKLRTAAEDSPKYALSGTPLKGKKHNLFGTLNWLWPKVYTSKWRWIESYFQVTTDTQWAGRARGNIVVKNITGKWASERDREAFFRSLSTVMIRRTKKELRAVNPAWMPPDKIYHDVWVPMDGAQRTHYAAMEKNARVTIAGETLTATGVLAEMTRLKQFAGSDGEIVNGNYRPRLPSGKFNWLLQFLEERGIEARDPRSSGLGDLSEDVHKIVIASQFTQLIKMWQAALNDKGITAYALTGETKDKERVAMVDAFQRHDNVRVFLINTTAGGVSITLDAADDIVIMDETWVPDDQVQVEDRVHRASNVTHQVDVWYVRTKDSIEEDIAITTEGKAAANHVVLDAQRGLEFARRVWGTTVQEEKS